jgi:hypothetical protein
MVAMRLSLPSALICLAFSITPTKSWVLDLLGVDDLQLKDWLTLRVKFVLPALGKRKLHLRVRLPPMLSTEYGFLHRV